MELRLKIGDVVGMEDGRHVLRVNQEDLRAALMEHQKWLSKVVVKDWLLKRPSLLADIIEDVGLRDTIYMREKARREEKAELRRAIDNRKASAATAKALSLYHQVLGL
jgi:hypothetical protein